jgi:FixJ family two-component response regulator
MPDSKQDCEGIVQSLAPRRRAYTPARQPPPAGVAPDCDDQTCNDVQQRTDQQRVSAACHDLRQPLQTLFLLQSLLEKCADGDAARKLAARLDVSLVAMADIVKKLAGTSHPSPLASSADLSVATPAYPVAVQSASVQSTRTIFVVDDDDELRTTLRCVLEDEGNVVRDFATGEAFLEHGSHSGDGCLLLDAHLPGISGFELLQQLHAVGSSLPTIMITGQSDVPMAVQAMKAGAVDFIEKPVHRDELLACIERAIALSRDQNTLNAWQQDAAQLISALTPRQREIMDRVLAGQPNKIIAADLGISQRTTENHRAAIMSRTGAKSLPALARLAIAAASVVAAGPERAANRAASL